MSYFKYDESPLNPGKYLIWANTDKLPITKVNGSLHVLQARLMNLSYANYLRMCRDIYGAEIIGRKTFLPVPYFSSVEGVKELIKILDKRVETILKGVQL